MPEAPNSPCISVCVVSPDGICLGCGRNLDEVAAWASATPAQQHQIVDAASDRLQALNAALFDGSDDK